MTDPIAHFAMADPDNVELTLTLTMSRRQWAEVGQSLDRTKAEPQRLERMIYTMLGELGPRMDATYSTTGWSGASKSPTSNWTMREPTS